MKFIGTIATVALLAATQTPTTPPTPSKSARPTQFMARMDAQEFEWVGKLPEHKMRKIKGATGGTCVFVDPDCEIKRRIAMPPDTTCYVFVRCPAQEATRTFTVQLGNLVSDPLCVSSDKGAGWRWARVGPFEHMTLAKDDRLTFRPRSGYGVYFDQIVVTDSSVLPMSNEPVQDFSKLALWKVPGPETLEGLEELNTDPPSYVSKQYIIMAPPEYAPVAVGWAKCIEEERLPKMFEVLGYTPALNVYAVIFKYDYPRNPAVYTGTGKFFNTDRITHRISIRCDKLDKMPPYQMAGGLVWETIHALLNDPKRQADWKPIAETEMLDFIFDLELLKRCDMQNDFAAVWKQATRDPKSNTTALSEFWKEYGWEPYQALLLKLHRNPTYKPTMDQSTFVYEMSLGAKRDVSAFFEKRGWTISKEKKELIAAELNQQ